jgi:transposase
LDMTNFATFIDTGNTQAPIAQRGKAKQKRTDLRLVGLRLVLTRAGGIPLLCRAYPGNKLDATQFPTMITTLAARHAGLTAANTGTASGDVADPAARDMTVVFDAGQNSVASFALLADTNLRYVGSVPASDCPGPTRPARIGPHHRRRPVRRPVRLRHPPGPLRSRT